MTTTERKVGLVTGAASGIGRATAEALARDGFDVALLSRTGDDFAPARRGGAIRESRTGHRHRRRRS